ncbi:MAG: glycosyltransferase family 2 protein [Bacteroidaceae bacterium]|nr:glycosyltransferase family 2 protein [Bacteroidaceae bacterium]
MLSILLPTYNVDCSGLINDLVEQASDLAQNDQQFQFEIIIADDASTRTDIKQKIKQYADITPCISYIALPQNIGRAAIRNLLIKAAQGQWILMIDDDAEVVKPDFIKTYWQLRNEADVICGDLINPTTMKPGHELRYKYERAAMPQRSAEVRNKAPYARFTTFNFFAKKTIIQNIGFSAHIKEYGYEDVVLGLELKVQGARVLHINNPLCHTGIDTNEAFLTKTEAALRTFAALSEHHQLQTTLGQTIQKIKKIRMHHIIVLLLTPLLPIMRKHLLGSNPNLTVFKLYKLGKACAELKDE